MVVNTIVSLGFIQTWDQYGSFHTRTTNGSKMYVYRKPHMFFVREVCGELDRTKGYRYNQKNIDNLTTRLTPRYAAPSSWWETI